MPSPPKGGCEVAWLAPVHMRPATLAPLCLGICWEFLRIPTAELKEPKIELVKAKEV